MKMFRMKQQMERTSKYGWNGIETEKGTQVMMRFKIKGANIKREITR